MPEHAARPRMHDVVAPIAGNVAQPRRQARFRRQLPGKIRKPEIVAVDRPRGSGEVTDMRRMRADEIREDRNVGDDDVKRDATAGRILAEHLVEPVRGADDDIRIKGVNPLPELRGIADFEHRQQEDPREEVDQHVNRADPVLPDEPVPRRHDRVYRTGLQQFAARRGHNLKRRITLQNVAQDPRHPPVAHPHVLVDYQHPLLFHRPRPPVSQDILPVSIPAAGANVTGEEGGPLVKELSHRVPLKRRAKTCSLFLLAGSRRRQGRLSLLLWMIGARPRSEEIGLHFMRNRKHAHDYPWIRSNLVKLLRRAQEEMQILTVECVEVLFPDFGQCKLFILPTGP